MTRIVSLVWFALAGAGIAHAADYAREERWAQEIVPALVVGDAVYLATPTRAKVLSILTEPSGTPAGGVVIVHGLGVHPDWGLIGGLRSGLAEAEFVTLSVQMPVLAAGATREDYAPTFAEAGERLDSAVAYLRAKGLRKIAIVSHSLGAAMVNVYLARPGVPAIDAWAPVGMSGAFAMAPKEPVLDVVAQTEIAPVAQTAPARTSTLPKDSCSRQITIASADHYFDTRQKELVAAIAAFLRNALGGRC